MIQAIVEQKKPTLGEKGQYGYVRKPEEKPKRSRKRKDDGPGAVPASDDDFLQAGPSHQLAMAMHMSLAAQDGHPHPGMTVPPVPVDLYPQGHPHLHNLPPHVGQLQPPTDGPVGMGVTQNNVVAVRKSPTGERMEDEEAEWDVKVGNDPPPLWAKRKVGDEEPTENGKRARVMFVPLQFYVIHNITDCSKISLVRKPMAAHFPAEFNRTAQFFTSWIKVS